MNNTIELKRAAVAEKYEATIDKDPVVHAGSYSGRLSNITLAGAEHFIKAKHPYIKERTEVVSAGKSSKASKQQEPGS